MSKLAGLIFIQRFHELLLHTDFTYQINRIRQRFIIPSHLLSYISVYYWCILQILLVDFLLQALLALHHISAWVYYQEPSEMPALSSSNPQASAQLRTRAIFTVQHSSSARNVHDQVYLRLKMMKCREM